MAPHRRPAHRRLTPTTHQGALRDASTYTPNFDGVLFFPVTPFTEAGAVDLDLLAQHIAKGVDAGPGGVFIACGTGEFHALEPQEFGEVVRTAVETVAGRVPVYAGAGGSIAQAKLFATAAKANGADGLLLLPPYLVEVPAAGLSTTPVRSPPPRTCR